MNTGNLHVDAPRNYPQAAISRRAQFCGQEWSHLWCDPGCEVDLHAAAAKLGLRRDWFQTRKGFPHYDLTRGKYWQARRLGIEVMDLRTWVEEQRLSEEGWREFDAPATAEGDARFHDD